MSPPTHPPIVALSATYGSGGVPVGRRVAEALGVRLLDQAWSPAELAEAQRQSSSRRFATENIRGDLTVDDAYVTHAVHVLASRDVIEASDVAVRELVASGGVVLGRAGPYLLRNDPSALRVLLKGPLEARIAAGAAEEGISVAEATERQQATDASRRGVAEHFYGADPDSVDQYHLVVDTIALGADTAVEFILAAARALPGRGV